MRMEKILVEHGAPTLAGLKTANLFSVRMGGDDLVSFLRQANRILKEKGMKVIPVRRRSGTALLYLFRPDRLEEDLNRPEALSLLREMGYPDGSYEKCIHCLIRHLKEDGLFLGYPPSDVRQFMKSSREGVKCSGCWKAYSNEQEAEKLFATYRRCTCIYRRKIEEGRSLESLAVRSSRRSAFRAVS